MDKINVENEKDVMFDSIIERHSTWLAVNPIQGCPNDCQYCFMKRNNMTRVKPHVLLPSGTVIEEIVNSRYYTHDVPICYFSKTDIMATKSNIEYLLDLLELIYLSDIYNTIVLVTKCYIPTNVIEKLTKLKDSGREVVVYISYSGLDSSIERGIDKRKALSNFYNLKQVGIKIIHYFRPLIPQNSSYEILDKVIGEVANYSIASVVTGLKVYEELKEVYSFWGDINQIENASEYECIWSGNVLDKLKKISRKYNYLIYQSNACALGYALGETDRYGIFDSDVCNNFNMCTPEIREKCKKNNQELSVGEIKSIFEKYGYKNIFFEVDNRTIYIKNYIFTNEEICFLSYYLHMKIINVEKADKSSGGYWNNNLNGAEQLYI